MKIKFDIDTQEKKVRVFIKNSELRTFVEKAMDTNRELSTEELSEKCSKVISYTFVEVLEKIVKANNLKLNDYKLEPKTYNHEIEIPVRLRETKF